MTREFSAGGAVFKKEVKEVLWLVTRSTPSKLYPKSVWRLPKGWIDDEGKGPGPITKGLKKASEEELQNSALREVKEEAGIEAKVVTKIGTETRFFTIGGQRVVKFITFYLMEWTRDLPEGTGFETSEVVWLPYKTTRKRLSYSSEKKTLEKAKALFEGEIQRNLL